MMESLALKYRPRTFDAMVGQPIVSRVLARLVELDNVPVGLLFFGSHGTGKTSAARILAHQLNPSAADAPVIEIDAASNGGVAEVRKLIDSLQYGFPGEHRVVIIDECHSMSREAYNALLKTLEEPPHGTIFVLVTTEPGKLPETVLSRLVSFEFSRVTPEDIFSRLNTITEEENLDVAGELMVYLAHTCAGSVRDAVMKLDQAALAGLTTVAEYRELVREIDTGPAFIGVLLTGDHAQIFALLDKALARVGQPSVILDGLIGSIRDLLVLKGGGQLEKESPLRELTGRVTVDQLTASARILWDLKTRIRFNDNAVSNLTLALVLLAESLSKNIT